MEDTKKTVYITRNALFRDVTMILCNNIASVDESFIEDNPDLFYTVCETCEGSGNVNEDKQCDDCMGDGQHDIEPYQFFLVSANDWTIERMKEYGVEVGYSNLLDLHVLPIYDYGTGWRAFSYSKEVDTDYQLAHDETEVRTTVY